MLHILTYNIQFGKKLTKIAQWIDSLESFPQILCFQEFPLDQKEWFMNNKHLKMYDSVYVESIKKGKKSFGQLTVFDKKALKLIKHTDVHLGTTRLEKILSYQSKGRNALLTGFKYRNVSFELINAHLVAFHLNDVRRNQIRTIMKSVQTDNENIPTVFLGDLNYSSLLRQSRFINEMKQYGFTNAFSIKTHKLFFIRHQLDYVFYKNCVVAKSEVIKINYSDHYPVLFQLKINK